MDNNFEQLVDKLDAEIAGTNANAATRYQGAAIDPAYAELRSIVAGIRDAGLYEQVGKVRTEFMASAPVQKEPAKVIQFNFMKTALRVAATIILILVSATTYKYLAVSDKAMYSEYYNSYQLNTNRSNASSDKIEKAYRTKSWQEVINVSSGTELNSNKEIFLVAMANMELKQFDTAIPGFTKILQRGKETDSYFVDEAEYYLAMSYLATNQSANALVLLKKIAADKDHSFYTQVRKMNLDMKILDMKN